MRPGSSPSSRQAIVNAGLRPNIVTFGDLREQVARARAGLQRLGIGPGDRVVAFLPNILETLVAFLVARVSAARRHCSDRSG